MLPHTTFAKRKKENKIQVVYVLDGTSTNGQLTIAPAISMVNFPSVAAVGISFAVVKNCALDGSFHVVACILHKGLYASSPAFVEATLA